MVSKIDFRVKESKNRKQNTVQITMNNTDNNTDGNKNDNNFNNNQPEGQVTVIKRITQQQPAETEWS